MTNLTTGATKGGVDRTEVGSFVLSLRAFLESAMDVSADP